jgi:serine protease
MRILSIFLLITFSLSTYGQVVPGLLFVKVKPEHKVEFETNGISHDALSGLPVSDSFLKIEQQHPNAKIPNGEKSADGRAFIDLTRTYRIETVPELNLNEAIRQLSETDLFEFVEPTTYSEIHYIPNDPWSQYQIHLTQHNILAAWDSTQGDTNVVIGITDTAIDLLHEDLEGNLKRNYADTIDGVDNDNDGYIDNFEGWDVFDDDNDLYFNGDFHGSAVCIVSSATPDNNVGATGNGFNCKFLPVKISNNSASPNIITSDGHLGIEYAVEHGASIVNCSWGTTTWSQAGQDVVDYATLNFDAVVIASAGNEEGYTAYYPASFANVISVTGIDTEDLFDNGVDDPFTNHDSIDIAALGHSVVISSTSGGPGVDEIYWGSGGTSLAAPQVSGVAGLIRSMFPCLSAFEVMDLLIESADVIDTIPANSAYAGKMGKKLNALAAVQANLCTTVSIQEGFVDDLKIYPNPTSDKLFWNGVAFNEKTTLMVMDLYGKKVIEQTITNSFGSLDVSRLRNGVYEVSFSGGMNASQKLVIQH